jgi:hypothetical protein
LQTPPGAQVPTGPGSSWIWKSQNCAGRGAEQRKW